MSKRNYKHILIFKIEEGKTLLFHFELCLLRLQYHVIQAASKDSTRGFE